MFFKKNKKGECVYTKPNYGLKIWYTYPTGSVRTDVIESKFSDELYEAKNNAEKDLQKDDKLKFLIIRTKGSSLLLSKQDITQFRIEVVVMKNEKKKI